MALLFGSKKLFIKPETVSFWRLFFFLTGKAFSIKTENNHAVSKIPDNM